MTDTTHLPPGLKGVAVTDTEIGDVRGQEGFYHYRQYSAIDLAVARSLEDVWQLLLDGDLPVDREARKAFAHQVRHQRDLPANLVDLLADMAAGASGDGAM